MKRAMAEEIKRHAHVQDQVNGFVNAAYTRHGSHSYAAGYIENVLAELLTYHVSDQSREHFLGRLTRAKEDLVAEQYHKVVQSAETITLGE